MTRLREARRIQRLQRVASPPTIDETTSPLSPPTVVNVDRTLQNRVILELAWKTVALMHKNKIIQQKINALQKETSEFIKSVMSNPDNQKRYEERMRLLALQKQQMQSQNETKNITLKIEPEA